MKLAVLGLLDRVEIRIRLEQKTAKDLKETYPYLIASKIISQSFTVHLSRYVGHFSTSDLGEALLP